MYTICACSHRDGGGFANVSKNVHVHIGGGVGTFQNFWIPLIIKNSATSEKVKQLKDVQNS